MENFIYPGNYVPQFSEIEILTELKNQHLESNQPRMTQVELPTAYKIEVEIPGVKREDLNVHIENSQLCILGLHKDGSCTCVGDNDLSLHHDYNPRCFNYNIPLPDDTDPRFMSAEYKDGILNLVISKSKHPWPRSLFNVVVY